jgi:hypothetical protein
MGKRFSIFGGNNNSKVGPASKIPGVVKARYEYVI